MQITRPLLAATLKDPALLKFPVAVAPKLDGIRSVIDDNRIALSRTFKPIRNAYIQSVLQKVVLPGMDGELMSGIAFQDCTSAIMSEDGTPDFVYNIFDWVEDELNTPYTERMATLLDWYKTIPHEFTKFINIVSYEICNNINEFYALEQKYLENGYEGIMVRSLDGVYKCGRSTLKEGTLLKFKRFVDSEAIVVGVEPLFRNTNEIEKDAFGLADRSQRKDGLVADELMGSLLVKDMANGIEFSIGTGFDQSQRIEIWANKDSYVGKIVKYKSFPTGVKDKPRFPTFLGFRDREDM